MVEPHAEQNPRSAFLETDVDLRVDDGEETGGEKVIDDSGKSMNARKAPPEVLRQVSQ
jgi:hypothetical protein